MFATLEHISFLRDRMFLRYLTLCLTVIIYKITQEKDCDEDGLAKYLKRAGSWCEPVLRCLTTYHFRVGAPSKAKRARGLR